VRSCARTRGVESTDGSTAIVELKAENTELQQKMADPEAKPE
jgi:hypothetical protein